MAAGTPPASSHERLLPLDGVRGFAILIVVLHNAGWIAGESEQFLLKLAGAGTAAGWVGVQLFFVLSGFLITGILLDTRHKARYFQSFYLRRTLRIFPLYYAFLALTVLVGPLVAWSPAWVEMVRLHHWPYWFYIQNWAAPFEVQITGLSHLWSLAVEEQFYLVWPLVVLLLNRRGVIGLSLLMIVGTPLLRLGMRLAGMPEYSAYMFTVARWDALAAGALIAALLRSPDGRAALARWQAPAAILAGVGLFVVVVVQRGFNSTEIPVQVIGQSVISMLSAYIVLLCVAGGSTAARATQRIFSAGWLRVLGKYSYAMYMFHLPIHQLLEPVLVDVVRGEDTPSRLMRLFLYLVLVLGLSLLAAIASWYAIERPFLNLKDRIAPRPA